MGIDAITGIGHGNQAEKAKKAKKQDSVSDGFNQVVQQYNMFKSNPALIGNLLNGSNTAATNQ